MDKVAQIFHLENAIMELMDIRNWMVEDDDDIWRLQEDNEEDD